MVYRRMGDQRPDDVGNHPAAVAFPNLTTGSIPSLPRCRGGIFRWVSGADDRAATGRIFSANQAVSPAILRACEARSWLRGTLSGSTCCEMKRDQLLRQTGYLRKTAADHRSPP